MSSSPVVGTREVAYRVFAAEFDDASLSYSESDEERAPNYVVTPTGARLNRTFVAGALTEVEHVNDEVLRGRIADPTGAFITYAGQYQPDPMAFLEQATPPAFVALAGKARTYEPDDADVVYTSIRPESINTIDADVRDRWLVTAAEATLNRIAVFDEALSMPQRGDELRRHLEARGVESTLAAGIPRAIDHYGTTRAYLEAVRTLAIEALELVAGERDQVENLTVSPGDEGDVTLGALPELDLLPADNVDVEPAESDTAEADDVVADADDVVADDDGEGETDEAEPEPEPTESEPESEQEPEVESEPDTVSAESAPESEPKSEPEPDPEPEPEPVESTTESLGDFDDESADESSSLDEPDLDELGDFDDDLPDIEDEADSEAAADVAADAETTTADSEADAVDPSGMYEMDDEERAEIESEFGTEFTSGSEVDPAGEADIDVPDVDEISEQMDEEVAESDDSMDATETDTTEAAETDEPEAEAAADAEEADDDTDAADTDSSADDTPAEDIDLESVVVDVMEDLDDGDGADHDDVVAAVVDEYGADVGAVEDAIQDALLGGRCYEPQDDVLKAI
ncbi:RPA family protein [Haloferax sp. DFSO52]|uniref:RPA family protein n=1 Tax=Haloferax sp. DFSO52 TaxID=3388505 RepID=UPI003A894325